MTADEPSDLVQQYRDFANSIPLWVYLAGGFTGLLLGFAEQWILGGSPAEVYAPLIVGWLLIGGTYITYRREMNELEEVR